MTIPIDRLSPWNDSDSIGIRSNDLMRENWLTVDECARMHNDGELDDPDALEELRDLMVRSLDVERKYAATRAAEFAETQRQWYVREFGAGYEMHLWRNDLVPQPEEVGDSHYVVQGR